MESKILEKAQLLAGDILECSEYQHFLNARAKVKEEGLEEQLKNFRSERFFLQAKGPDSYRSGIGDLEDRYRELVTHFSVKEYLDNEIKVCRIVQKITGILTEGLELDLDFL